MKTPSKIHPKVANKKLLYTISKYISNDLPQSAPTRPHKLQLFLPSHVCQRRRGRRRRRSAGRFWRVLSPRGQAVSSNCCCLRPSLFGFGLGENGVTTDSGVPYVFDSSNLNCSLIPPSPLKPIMESHFLGAEGI